MKKYEIAVIGGGMTGTAAAIAAARQGKRVLLVEQGGALSGAMTHSLVYPFMNYYETVNQKRRYLVGGILGEIRDRAIALGGPKNDNDYSDEHIKFALDLLCEEAGVDVLFHTTVFEVKTEGRRLVSVKAATCAGVLEIEADEFLDASGDGILFFLAGCDFAHGREGDGLCQPMTTCFRVGNINEAARTPAEKARLQALYKEYQAKGKITNPRENMLIFNRPEPGVLHFNTTRIVKHDPTDPFSLSEAERLARKQVFELFGFLKENSEVYHDAYIISIASRIGVRESRLLRGRYVLTVEDLLNCTLFEDRIALGNYAIDVHSPTGTGTEYHEFGPGHFYSVPYRSLVPKEYDNLLVAGRCLSADHEAQSAVRIMPTVTAMGEAAGVALSMALEQGCSVGEIDIPTLQAVIRQNGGILE